MSYFIGINPSQVLDSFIKRFFYGIRRNDDGELYLVRSDQLGSGNDNDVVINDIGIATDSYLDFEEGIDFLSGVDEDHEIVFKNLRYPQFKWDSRALSYFLNVEDGQLIQRLSEAYIEPEFIATPGFGEVPDDQVLQSYSRPTGDY